MKAHKDAHREKSYISRWRKIDGGLAYLKENVILTRTRIGLRRVCVCADILRKSMAACADMEQNEDVAVIGYYLKHTVKVFL